MKLGIPHRQHLVYDENFRFQMGCHGKGEADIHAGGIAFDGRIQKFLHASEIHDFVEFPFNLCSRHTEDGAIEEDVFPPSEFGMETGADLQERRHSPAQGDTAFGRFGDAGENLEQGAFPCSVAADDTEHLATLDLEGNVLQRPEFLDLVTLDDLASTHHIEGLAGEVFPVADKGVAQGVVAFPRPLVTDQVALGKIFDGDDGVTHERLDLEKLDCLKGGSKN
ncbi:hypothetical protein OPIT5_28465 [Opitutaceae bacterium TAV5]|nr:hypothetical protein OPIT5_28465 [Opitutaceae bacterium TAV5]